MGEVLSFNVNRSKLLAQAYSAGFTAGEQHGYAEGFKDALKLIGHRAQTLADASDASKELYVALADGANGTLSQLIKDLLRR